jgi:hypothetical protein
MVGHFAEGRGEAHARCNPSRILGVRRGFCSLLCSKGEIFAMYKKKEFIISENVYGDCFATDRFILVGTIISKEWFPNWLQKRNPRLLHFKI